MPSEMVTSRLVGVRLAFSKCSSTVRHRSVTFWSSFSFAERELDMVVRPKDNQPARKQQAPAALASGTTAVPVAADGELR